MRLIDANALITELEKDESQFDKEAEEARNNPSAYTDGYADAMWSRANGIRDAMIEIYDAPTIDIERPQGEWIAVSAFDAFGGDEATWMAHGNPTAFHYCSECKEQSRLDEFGEEMLSKYCPNCGAKMKGAGDE